jgi:hypothetical protein
MEDSKPKPEASEEEMMKLYREISGGSEASARNVVMQLDNTAFETKKAAAKTNPEQKKQEPDKAS